MQSSWPFCRPALQGCARQSRWPTVRALSALTRVGHAQDAGPVVLDVEVLVLEVVAVDADGARAVAVDDVASCRGQSDIYLRATRAHLLAAHQQSAVSAICNRIGDTPLFLGGRV